MFFWTWLSLTRRPAQSSAWSAVGAEAALLLPGACDADGWQSTLCRCSPVKAANTPHDQTTSCAADRCCRQWRAAARAAYIKASFWCGSSSSSSSSCRCFCTWMLSAAGTFNIHTAIGANCKWQPTGRLCSPGRAKMPYSSKLVINFITSYRKPILYWLCCCH